MSLSFDWYANNFYSLQPFTCWQNFTFVLLLGGCRPGLKSVSCRAISECHRPSVIRVFPVLVWKAASLGKDRSGTRSTKAQTNRSHMNEVLRLPSNGEPRSSLRHHAYSMVSWCLRDDAPIT